MTKKTHPRKQPKLTFHELPSWYSWTEKSDANTESITPCTFSLLRTDGSRLCEVTVTRVSQARRYPGLRSSKSAYYISNVVIKDGRGVMLGSVAVRFDFHGSYSVAVERYSGAGHYHIVRLDGGGYDVKERGQLK